MMSCSVIIFRYALSCSKTARRWTVEANSPKVIYLLSFLVYLTTFVQRIGYIVSRNNYMVRINLKVREINRTWPISIYYSGISFKVFTSIEILVCSLVGVSWTVTLKLWTWRQHTPPKLWHHPPTWLSGVTTQNTRTLTILVLRKVTAIIIEKSHATRPRFQSATSPDAEQET